MFIFCNHLNVDSVILVHVLTLWMAREQGVCACEMSSLTGGRSYNGMPVELSPRCVNSSQRQKDSQKIALSLITFSVRPPKADPKSGSPSRSDRASRAMQVFCGPHSSMDGAAFSKLCKARSLAFGSGKVPHRDRGFRKEELGHGACLGEDGCNPQHPQEPSQ